MLADLENIGLVQADARRFATPLCIGLLAAIAAVSLYTPFLNAKYYETWFTWPGLGLSAVMPLIVAVIGCGCIGASRRDMILCLSC